VIQFTVGSVRGEVAQAIIIGSHCPLDRELVLGLYNRRNTGKEVRTMEVEHVPGKNVGHAMLYALSTCPWCQKTKRLLNELGVEYYYVDVDYLDGDEKAKVIEDVKKWNPACSFPTLVLDDKKCIVGFKEDEIRKALKK
jgi:glutaredoxin-like protein NrdH